MIRLENVTKTFGSGSTALSDINIGIEKGEFVFLVGQTGSGKTTLLRLLVKELNPTSGAILIDDYDIAKLPANKIPQLRKKIGVVFQDLKLLADRTILENIILPMEVAGVSTQQAIQRAEELLEQVGILSHKDKFPIQLSGGELQRAAIARALALSPDILLADEPTGNLDEKTAFEIVDLLSNINQQGTTIVMATHNMDIVEKLQERLIALESGKLILDKPKGNKSTHKEHKKSSSTHEDKHAKEDTKLEEKDQKVKDAEAKEEKLEEKTQITSAEEKESIPSDNSVEANASTSSESKDSSVKEEHEKTS